MAEADLLEEIEDLKELVDSLQTQIANLKDERDRDVEALEAKCELIKEKTDNEWKMRMKAAERESRDRLETMMLELDTMRQAFSGDAGGWEEVTKRNGEVYYQNTETGEIRETEPEVLFVARAMKRVEEADTMMEELATLRKTCKDLELKNREATLTVNKVKSEMNSLKKQDKQWKESAKVVFHSLNGVKAQLDAQMDQIMAGLTAVSKGSFRLHFNVPNVQKCREKVEYYQDRVANGEKIRMQLEAQVRSLTLDLEDKTRRVERLSAGLDEEVERLVKPIRSKISESMVLVMKEKAARAQERRELADMWPDTHLLPTILMKYRTLSAQERARRVEAYHRKNANLALSLEIRANVIESKMWEMKYDDYGRPYYEHKTTGEISQEEPAIISYKPPPGRDESGNIVQENSMGGRSPWTMMTDNRGEVYWKHNETDEISYVSPDAYLRIPEGKSKEQRASEAAKIVLEYITERISAHIAKKKRLKLKSENPVTGEEKRLLREKGGQAERDAIAAAEAEAKAEAEDDPLDEGAKYQYDIETVEMLAAKIAEIKGDEREFEEIREEKLAFLKDKDVRSFDPDDYVGPTLVETDVTDMGENELREIVEKLATLEEKLDRRLTRARTNLKDFSLLLMERLLARDKERLEERKREAELKAQERREQIRRDRIEQKRAARRKRREEERLAREAADGASKAEAEDAPQNEEGLSIAGGEEVLGMDSGVVEDTNASASAGIEGPHGSDEAAVSGLDGDGAEQKSIGGSVDKKSLEDASVDDGGTLEGSSLDADTKMTQSLSEEQKGTEIDGADDNVSETSELTAIDLIEDYADPNVLIFGDIFVEASNPEYPEEIVSTTANLANFALFCGYANIRIDELPYDSNHVMNLEQDDGEKRTADDQWLTNSFFMCITKEKIDGLRETIARQYDPMLGILQTSPLSTTRLMEDALSTKQSPNLEAYTPGIAGVNEKLKANHALWKMSQLMAEVLRFQFQQVAVRDAYEHRLQGIEQEPLEGRQISKMSLMPVTAARRARDFPTELRLKKVVAKDVSERVWADQQLQYVQLTLGGWTWRTNPINGTKLMVWDDLDVSVVLPIQKIQLDDLLVEVFDLHHLREDIRLSSRRKSVSHCLGPNVGRDMIFEFDMRNKKGVSRGVVEVTLRVDYIKEVAPGVHNPDPLSLDRAEDNPMTSNTPDAFIPMLPFLSPREMSIGNGDAHSMHTGKSGQSGQILESGESIGSAYHSQMADDLSGVIQQSLADQQSHFGSVVAELRGDSNAVKDIIGDITMNDLLRKGYRINENTVQRLPDIKKASAFLVRKATLCTTEVEEYMQQIDECCKLVEEVLARKLAEAQERLVEEKASYKKLIDSAEDTRNRVKSIQDYMDEVRNPAKQIIMPYMPELPEIPYVLKIPGTGAIDAKGKKKKQIPNSELRTLLEAIEAGEHDGKEWDFGAFWPTQAQQIKINKALTTRNDSLDAKRAAELETRDKVMKGYYMELERWENQEKQRVITFKKTRKDSRKANLRLDCFNERAARRQVMLQNIESDYAALQLLYDTHVKSRDRFKTMRAKQYLENKRHKESMQNLRLKLLKLLDARKRALDSPLGAANEVQFEYLRNISQEALRILRVEVAECKQALVEEGIRLRYIHTESTSLCKNEMIRLRMTLETLRAKDDIDQILKRNQYEVLHLMEAMEKLVMIEADKDEHGLRDTIDNKGERYTPDKKWESNEIIACQRLIDLVMAKISLVEGMATSASVSVRCASDAISTKWGTDFTPTRDSWCENSDYERSKRLLRDTLDWLAIQRQILGNREKEAAAEATELRLQVLAAEEQANLMLKNQESETYYVTESAAGIVKVMQDHIAKLRVATLEKEQSLEEAITTLSRECQGIREENLRMRQANEERGRILWAVIATLQSACQSLTARMEILTEERDRVVIKTKLEADKVRSQLRMERRHCANLLFIIHSQRGTVRYLLDVIQNYTEKADRDATARKRERAILRKEIWDQIFAFSRLSTDVNALFEFFTARLANLAGSRKSFNDDLANNGATVVLAALCKSPRAIIRKYAARALGGIGWDGYVETRILLWDCVMHWKLFKAAVIRKERHAHRVGFEKFAETGKFDALLNIDGIVEEFVPSGNMSLRTIIKQRRQWALRATRRNEGPNVVNQRMINIKDGVIQSLLEICVQDSEDWEIARNAALAISVASFEMSNHYDMTNDRFCTEMLIRMCTKGDPEVQTHAAVTIANLCHKDEHAQAIFGNSEAIPALVEMCNSTVVDVLEASTSALANITSFCDPNCERAMRAGAVAVMVRLITSSWSENLLDLDQNDEVHANASEMLANVSRYNGEITTKYFDRAVVDAMVFMCASQNKQVKRHAPLVLGNISQSAECREDIGNRGGIEALFLVLEDEDQIIQANTLWALCNLMWHPPNQERAGRFMSEIIKFMQSPFIPVKSHAIILLANCLYYNSSNRVRFLETEGSMEMLIQFIWDKTDKTIMEGSLRAVLALSYLDNVALWLGTDGKCIPLFISLIQLPHFSRDTARFSLEILGNLCVHHVNRRTILDNQGIEAIVTLHNDPDPHMQELSVQIIEHLEDVTPADVIARAKMDIGLERMVVLASNDDPIVRAVAAEAIGEEVWHNPKMQARTLEVGGVDALLAIIANREEGVGSLLPALWSVRNLLHNNFSVQAQFAHRDGVLAVNMAISRCIAGHFGNQTEKVLEAALACLANAILNHERNSRRLLVVGLESLMDIADGKLPDVMGASASVRGGMAAEGVVALAKSILLMLGPYNYIVCRHCLKKQDLHGQTCYSCGHRLRVDVLDSEREQLKQRMGAIDSKTGGGEPEEKSKPSTASPTKSVRRKPKGSSGPVLRSTTAS